MVDKEFCDGMAAAAALKAASYSATSTSKMKKGYLAEAAAWTALGERLTVTPPPVEPPPVEPPPVEPPPVDPPPVTPPPSNGLMWALDPAQYQNVGAPAGARVWNVGGADGRYSGSTGIEDVYFNVNDWFGVMPNGSPRVFRRCTFDGVNFATGGNIGAWGENDVFEDCLFLNCENFMRLNSGVTVRRCWMHSSKGWPGSHVDGIEVYAGAGILLEDVRIEIPTNADTGDYASVGATAALNIATDFGPISDVTIRRTVLLGGGYPLLVRSNPGKPIVNVRLEDVVIDGGRWTTSPVNGDGQTHAAITQWDNVRKLDGTPWPRP